MSAVLSTSHQHDDANGNSADPTPAVPPKLVVLLTYRVTVDAASIERINFEGWKEVLDAFGYASLTLQRCKEELALKSPHEVMTSLCPFTTKAEWVPLLNKRDVRLERDVRDLCFAEVMPIDGIKEFLIDCSKHAQTSVVLMSPFRETIARQLLDVAGLSPFVDLVHSYTEQEFGLLEACERLNMRPPKIPSSLRHRWEAEDEEAAKREEDEEVRDGNVASQPDEAQRCQFLSIASDADTLRFAEALGIPSIAVTCNLNDEEEDAHVSTHEEAALLTAGARCAVSDYTSLKYEYLPLR